MAHLFEATLITVHLTIDSEKKIKIDDQTRVIWTIYLYFSISVLWRLCHIGSDLEIKYHYAPACREDIETIGKKHW